jgi:hypothetical protein
MHMPLWELEDPRIFIGMSSHRCLRKLMATSVFEAELGDIIPVVHTSIGGTRIIGRLTAGLSPILCLLDTPLTTR